MGIWGVHSFTEVVRNTACLVQVRHGSNLSFFFYWLCQERSIVEHVAGEGSLKCFGHEVRGNSHLCGIPVVYANKQLDELNG